MEYFKHFSYTNGSKPCHRENDRSVVPDLPSAPLVNLHSQSRKINVNSPQQMQYVDMNTVMWLDNDAHGSS